MKQVFFISMLVCLSLLSCKTKQINSSEIQTTCDRCTLIPDAGMCRAAIPKYYFDKEEGKCREFIWGGCGGVVPFNSMEECLTCNCKSE